MDLNSNSGAVVVVVLNLASTTAAVTLELGPSCKTGLILCPQPAPKTLVKSGNVETPTASLPSCGSWKLQVPPQSWAVYSVALG